MNDSLNTNPTTQAFGEFEVDVQPLEGYAVGIEGISLGRMSIDKRFTGDLDATSQGEMLSARTAVSGSAGYVAIEQVDGALHGRRGTFVLQHFGLMTRGSSLLLLKVVPDSGTGELVNLTGTMLIKIEDGVHRYEFDYTFDGG